MIALLPENIHRRMLQAVSTVFCVSLLANFVAGKPQAIITALYEEPQENVNILLQKLASKTARSLDLDVKNSPGFTPKAENFAECANGSTFCESIEGYPSTHINDMFVQEALKRTFDNKYEVELSPVETEDEPNKKPLCKSVTKVIRPNITKIDEATGSNKFYQMKEGIEVEECMQPGGSCSSNERLPAGFKAVCKQKHVYTQLLMADPEGVESKQGYLVPTGCVCSLKTAESGLKLKDSEIAALLLSNEYIAKPE